jgi:anti-anti-sigma factor
MNAEKELADAHNRHMSVALASTASGIASPHRRGGLSATAACCDDVALIALRGELDIATSCRVDAAVRAMLSSGRSELLFDLTELTFLDCAGLGALRRAARTAEAAGARCYVFRANGQPGALIAWGGQRGVNP